jgi:hypothetical protein
MAVSWVFSAAITGCQRLFRGHVWSDGRNKSTWPGYAVAGWRRLHGGGCLVQSLLALRWCWLWCNAYRVTRRGLFGRGTHRSEGTVERMTERFSQSSHFGRRSTCSQPLPIRHGGHSWAFWHSVEGAAVCAAKPQTTKSESRRLIGCVSVSPARLVSTSPELVSDWDPLTAPEMRRCQNSKLSCPPYYLYFLNIFNHQRPPLTINNAMRHLDPSQRKTLKPLRFEARAFISGTQTLIVVRCQDEILAKISKRRLPCPHLPRDVNCVEWSGE